MLPIRWRLTLGYSLFLSLALIALGTVVYVLLSHNLQAELDQRLITRTAEVQRSLRVTGDSLLPQEGAASIDLLSQRLSLPDAYLQVMDPQGTVVLASSNLQGQQLPVDPTVILEALEGKPSLAALPMADGRRVRVGITPIIHGEQVIGIIQVGELLYALDSSLHRLGYILALGILGTWILFSLGGWLLAGRALRPLTHMSQAADHIGATGDFSQRIAYVGPRDEVGHLATTFNHMIERIQGAFQAQRQFVADASHELGSPLTTIRGNLDLLRRNLHEKDREECLLAMQGEAIRMDRIIGDLLTLAQMEGQPHTQHLPVSMDLLLSEVYGQTRRLAGKRRIRIDWVEPATVAGDVHQLSQALFNLVDNAIKYTPENGAIGLSLSRSGPWALVKVADTGVGIPHEDLPHIFDRFYRVDKARSRARGGTGLGLSIVKAAAEAHGGRVTVESTPGKGSTFTLWLPISNSPLSPL